MNKEFEEIQEDTQNRVVKIPEEVVKTSIFRKIYIPGYGTNVIMHTTDFKKQVNKFKKKNGFSPKLEYLLTMASSHVQLIIESLKLEQQQEPRQIQKKQHHQVLPQREKGLDNCVLYFKIRSTLIDPFLREEQTASSEDFLKFRIYLYFKEL